MGRSNPHNNNHVSEQSMLWNLNYIREN